KDEFCCLGVACDLAYKAGLISEPISEETDSEQRYWYGDAWAYLPSTVQDWLGLQTDNGEWRGGDNSLGYKNDRGLTFLEIADLIESDPEGLFVEVQS